MRAEPNKTVTAGRREGERGAALVTVLLIAALLLAAGSALILTTSNATGVAGDATTEMQAYYAAEAGMQQVMAVVRRNAASNPAGTPATFSNLLLPANSTLAPWLTYANVGGQQRVIISASPSLSYTVEAKPLDLDTPPGEEPSRILFQVRGFGPRGSVKQMEMIVHRSPYDLDPPAALTFIGAESGPSMQAGVNPGDQGDFDIGQSSDKGYSGDDQAGFKTDRSPFAFTVAADRDLAETKFADPESKASTSTDNTPSRTTLISQSALPPWLRTAPAARAFLEEMRLEAKGSQTPSSSNQSRYFTASPAMGNYGTDAHPLLTFVDGNCDFKGEGAGLLIVTGKLVINGGATFRGVILLLGQGRLERNGAGGGGLYGALVMGNLDAAGSTYLARPVLSTDGAGTSEIKYNSVDVNRAFATLSPVVRDVREF